MLAANSGYQGPERRLRPANSWLSASLDEVDYGLILVDREAQIIYLNHAAVVDLDEGHPLQQIGHRLRARCSRDVGALGTAIEAAFERGRRALLTMGEASDERCVSVVPVGPSDPDQPRACLLMLGKRRQGSDLAVQGYARAYGMTGSEARVLQALCQGMAPGEIARRHDVAISTIRTQIGSIRAKTGAASIRDLVHQVATLPPLMSVLRERPRWSSLAAA